MWLLLVAIYFIFAIVSYSIVARLPLTVNFVFKFLGCGGLFWIVLSAHLLALNRPMVETLAGMLLFAFGWELLIFLFAMTSTSVSVGLLRRIDRTPMSLHQVSERYSTEFMVGTRLERLVSDGYLTQDGDEYTLTPRACGLLRVFGALRGFFRHPPLRTPDVVPIRSSQSSRAKSGELV